MTRVDLEAYRSGRIESMPANEVMQPIHERMPSIIAPANYEAWLDTGVTDRDVLMNMLDTAASVRLEHYPVSPYVNSAKHDDERCIQAL